MTTTATALTSFDDAILYKVSCNYHVPSKLEVVG